MCNEGKGNPIIQWMMFINDESKEVLEMLSKDIPEIKKSHKLPPKLQESIRNASSTTLDLLEEKVFDTETIEEISELIEKE